MAVEIDLGPVQDLADRMTAGESWPNWRAAEEIGSLIIDQVARAVLAEREACAAMLKRLAREANDRAAERGACLDDDVWTAVSTYDAAAAAVIARE